VKDIVISNHKSALQKKELFIITDLLFAFRDDTHV